MITIPLEITFQAGFIFPEIFEKFSMCDIFCCEIVYNSKGVIS